MVYRGTAVPDEPCQCPDCQRFYREHDRLIRENPRLRQQQELNWAALQAFRTLAGRVLEDLQKNQEPGSAPAPLAADQTHSRCCGRGRPPVAP